MSELRLNIGGGEISLDGFQNIDRKCGLEAYPLPYGADSVDEIRASHVLEHFGHRRTAKVLANWVACLKPGSRIRLAVPDFRWIAERYLRGEPIDIQAYTMGGQVDENDAHYAIFDRNSLMELMIGANLERISPWKSEVQDCARLPVSLNLQGYKPLSEEKHLANTLAVLSCPRFGPTLHARAAFTAFARAHVPYNLAIGAYWHQILSESIEAAIRQPDCEFVITSDYDSVFTHEDITELYRLIRACDDANAVVSLQMRRSDEVPLFGLESGKVFRVQLSKNLLRVDRGHFGLTILRASSLREHSRPWMTPVCNGDGRWGKGRTDADIDFWRRWKEAGYTVYLAPKIVVGHLEETVIWPGEEFRPIHQPIKEYMTGGVPADVMH